MEGITADQIPGYSRKKWAMQPNPQEEAVERWIDALQVMQPTGLTMQADLNMKSTSLLPLS